MKRCYPEEAKLMEGAADHVCGGKLIVRTSSNAPGNVTESVIPNIVKILAEMRKD